MRPREPSATMSTTEVTNVSTQGQAGPAASPIGAGPGELPALCGPGDDLAGHGALPVSDAQVLAVRPAEPVSVPVAEGVPPLTFRGELPPSLAYQVRWWLWKPTPEGPYAGELTITQVGRSKTDITVYLVEVVPFEGRGTLRAFLLANQKNGEVYAVELNGMRGDDCTCKSSQCRKQCKHPPTLRAMVARGLI